MTNKNPKRRRVPTITFQPSDDVAEVLELVTQNKERSYKTQVINEALKASLPFAAEADEAAEKARRAVLNEGRRRIQAGLPITGLREQPQSKTSTKRETALKPQKPARQEHS